MRPDQERVRNLLIDTVTLLCKNSVQFKDELHVEGLLGVSVDKKDVFFVHISKEFTNSPSDGATVTQDSTNSQDEESRLRGDPAEKEQRVPPTDSYEPLNIKSEKIEENADLEDECLIVEDPHVKLEGVASPAHMVAGQRRALKRTSHSSQQYADNSDYSGAGYAMDSNSGYGPAGEPLSKRRADDQDDSYSQDNGDSGGTGWPTIAGMSGFDPSQQHSFQQDSDNSQMSMPDGSQPGCSSWSAGPSESVVSEQPAGVPRIVTPRRVYECPICGKTFFGQRKRDFQCHVRSHTGEKPFVCDFCGHRFSDPRSMSRHRRSQHLRFIQEESTGGTV